jgi:hypothetical protein
VIQTSGLELCYSGGMTIDASDSNSIYCSVPVDGAYGNIYEIIKFIILTDGDTVTVANTSITRDSSKNNARPYSIPNTENLELKLIWLYGDYYDWIVSSTRPRGFPTEIHCNSELPTSPVDLSAGLIKHDISKQLLHFTEDTDFVVIDVDGDYPAFTVSLLVYLSEDAYYGKIVEVGEVIYEVDETSIVIPPL